jgi:anti-sigma regulatory factor (Ser/Thr protein kinase)
MPHTLTLRFYTDPAMFRAIRRLVANLVRTAGGFTQAAYELEVVTGELLNNAHEHAYGGQIGPVGLDSADLRHRPN